MCDFSICRNLTGSASISPELYCRSCHACRYACLWPSIGLPVASLRYAMYFRFYGYAMFAGTGDAEFKPTHRSTAPDRVESY